MVCFKSKNGGSSQLPARQNLSRRNWENLNHWRRQRNKNNKDKLCQCCRLYLVFLYCKANALTTVFWSRRNGFKGWSFDLTVLCKNIPAFELTSNWLSPREEISFVKNALVTEPRKFPWTNAVNCAFKKDALSRDFDPLHLFREGDEIVAQSLMNEIDVKLSGVSARNSCSH